MERCTVTQCNTFFFLSTWSCVAAELSGCPTWVVCIVKIHSKCDVSTKTGPWTNRTVLRVDVTSEFPRSDYPQGSSLTTSCANQLLMSGCQTSMQSFSVIVDPVCHPFTFPIFPLDVFVIWKQQKKGPRLELRLSYKCVAKDTYTESSVKRCMHPSTHRDLCAWLAAGSVETLRR